MRFKYRAKDEKSWKLRFHTQTAGCSLTAQQPENNIARTGFQALAAVLGGTQSLHTNSMDETLALPTEKAAEIALRTQQLIAYETGVPNVVDPLGGSWYLENLTDKIEKEVEEYFIEIDNIGGVIPAIEQGYFQREISISASDYQSKLDFGKRVMVGANAFINKNEVVDIPIMKIGSESQNKQTLKLKSLKSSRNPRLVRKRLSAISKAASGDDNLMYPIIEASKEYATLGEIVGAMKEVFGDWNEGPIF